MKKLIALMVALFVATPALAEEVVTAVPDTGSPFWNVMAYVLGIVLVPAMGLVMKLIYEWQAKLASEKGEADLSFKAKLKLMAERVLARLAVNIANKELVDIKAAAADGKVTKNELKELGESTIKTAKAELGPAIAKAVGDMAFRSILREQVDKLNSKQL